MAINKVIYGDEVLIDLTGLTVAKETMLSGTTALDKSGTLITGECTFDVDSSDATVAVTEMLATKTAYARGAKITGTMPNVGKQSNVTISTKTGTVTIAQGYHDGSAKVGISSTEQTKIVANNIRKGVTILGVEGNLETGSQEIPQSKTVTPTKNQQVITPDTGYTCLRQVTVEAIPYTESQNSAGGTTVTIA